MDERPVVPLGIDPTPVEPAPQPTPDPTPVPKVNPLDPLGLFQSLPPSPLAMATQPPTVPTGGAPPPAPAPLSFWGFQEKLAEVGLQAVTGMFTNIMGQMLNYSITNSMGHVLPQVFGRINAVSPPIPTPYDMMDVVMKDLDKTVPVFTQSLQSMLPPFPPPLGEVLTNAMGGR